MTSIVDTHPTDGYQVWGTQGFDNQRDGCISDSKDHDPVAHQPWTPQDVDNQTDGHISDLEEEDASYDLSPEQIRALLPQKPPTLLNRIQRRLPKWDDSTKKLLTRIVIATIAIALTVLFG